MRYDLDSAYRHFRHMVLLIALIFGLGQYALASAIGLQTVVAAVVALQTGVVAGMLVGLGGVPTTGRGLGRRLI
jgi:hypothetical protein